MPFYIPIIVGSTRRDRQSIKVARFVLSRLQQRKNVETELLDLLEYNFPIMEERLHRRRPIAAFAGVRRQNRARGFLDYRHA